MTKETKTKIVFFMLLRVLRPDSKWRSTCQLLGFLKGENRVGLALWAPWPGCSLAYCSPSSVAMGPTTSFFGANVAMAVAPHIFDWANAGNTSYIETSLNWELFCDTHQAFTIFLSKLSKLSWSVFTKMSIFKTSTSSFWNHTYDSENYFFCYCSTF